MASIQLQGKIFLQGSIHALTGLHIGGSAESLDIGGIDNPVIRNPLNREPYIPGSSLRGKMRALLDRHFNNTLNNQGSVQVHECRNAETYAKCPVCQVFGVTPQRLKEKTMPARLIVRDIRLDPQSRRSFEKIETDGLYTEAKWEVSIDRITSEANPRQNERVPAGTIFDPFQLIFGLYTRDNDTTNQLKSECDLFDTVLKGMELLEDDYLGGSGSRGSGQIEFRNLTMTLKSRECYEKADKAPISISLPEDTDIKAARQSDYVDQIQNAISAE